ncbi:hypothetical protein LY78DRAFT_372541 [Colletotrichum sublineola]|nr:hypothetical protein LY78DRAFT_372541 [Colletotrichum sublineola]
MCSIGGSSIYILLGISVPWYSHAGLVVVYFIKYPTLRSYLLGKRPGPVSPFAPQRGRTAVWMDGWMDGWMAGWLDGMDCGMVQCMQDKSAVPMQLTDIFGVGGVVFFSQFSHHPT